MLSEQLKYLEAPRKNVENIKGIFLDVDLLAHELQMIRERDKKVRIGMIEGAFNRIHKGQLQYFTEAKKHCDILVVMVERPQSIRRARSHGHSDGVQSNAGLGDKLRTLQKSQGYVVDWLEFDDEAEHGKRFMMSEMFAHAGVDYILVNPYVIDYKNDPRAEEMYINNEMKMPDMLFANEKTTHEYLASRKRRAKKVGYEVVTLPEFPKQPL